MHKWHGMKEKKKNQKKHKQSKKGIAQQKACGPKRKEQVCARHHRELDEELAKNGDTKMGPGEKDACVDHWLCTPGMLRSFPTVPSVTLSKTAQLFCVPDFVSPTTDGQKNLFVGFAKEAKSTRSPVEDQQWKIAPCQSGPSNKCVGF